MSAPRARCVAAFVAVALAILGSGAPASAEPPCAEGGVRLKLLQSVAADGARGAPRQLHLQLDRQRYAPEVEVFLRVIEAQGSAIPARVHPRVEIIAPDGQPWERFYLPREVGPKVVSWRLPASAPAGRWRVRVLEADSEVCAAELEVLRPAEAAVEAPGAPSLTAAVQAQPEGGALVVGVESRVFLTAPPARGELLLAVDDTGQIVAVPEVDDDGLGSFLLQPEARRQYSLRRYLRGQLQEVVALPAPQEVGCGLRLLPSAAGEGLAVEVRCTSPREVLALVTSQTGVLALERLTVAPNVPTRAALAAGAPGPTLVEVTLLDGQLRVLAARRGLLAQERALRVELGPSRQLRVLDHAGQPVQATGLEVVTAELEPRYSATIQRRLGLEALPPGAAPNRWLNPDAGRANADMSLGLARPTSSPGLAALQFDGDGDGVPDLGTRCAEDERSGCLAASDRDQDGLPDARDACPCAPEDLDGFEDADGCPEPDNDRDGVPDVVDPCPNEPETINGRDDADGCPEKLPLLLIADELVIHDKVFFTRGDALPPLAAPLLDELAQLFRLEPDLLVVTVEGHATGPRAAASSQARAERVREALIARGVEPERLVVRAYGDALPLDAGRGPAATARNNRVGFAITAATWERDAKQPRGAPTRAPLPPTLRWTPALAPGDAVGAAQGEEAVLLIEVEGAGSFGVMEVKVR